MTLNSTDTPTLRTDGGRPTPGVPEVSEDATDGPDAEADTTTESESPRRQETASGKAMPGVPQTPGGSAPARGHEHGDGGDGGGSCGTDAGRDETEHDLTTAISLRALKRTQTPRAVVAEARSWSDWVGVVGEESGPTMNTFFRKSDVDVDFFNDASGGPTEMLKTIDEGHHFHSERQVLIGLPDEAAWAEAAGWEFQPFEEVAETSGWAVEDA